MNLSLYIYHDYCSLMNLKYIHADSLSFYLPDYSTYFKVLFPQVIYCNFSTFFLWHHLHLPISIVSGS